MLYDLRSITQIIGEHRQGALGQDVWEERLSAGELRHDIDGEGEGTQVLLGWVRS
jgi:hypothetical protein